MVTTTVTCHGYDVGTSGIRHTHNVTPFEHADPENDPAQPTRLSSSTYMKIKPYHIIQPNNPPF
jgi:hypothetical protein